MAMNYFNRYVWLIDVISRYGHITKRDIDGLWSCSSLNERHEKEIPERTFHNHREAIRGIFGIEIAFDRGLGYYIDNPEDLDGEGIRSWLLESISLSNLLRESADMRSRILFEKVPSSSKWLSVIVNAMRDSKALEMTYQSFKRTEPTTFETHPYCLKVFRQRWYMLAWAVGKEELRIFSLDRIIDIKVLDKVLELPAGFEAADFFSDYFGIIIGHNVKPSIMEIKATAEQAKYLESLPLHPSQEIIEVTPEYTVFRYRLVPTFDLKQEILSRGSTLEVLSPDWFRKEIIDELQKSLLQYGK
ncbi:MAG: WYL domain-containing protein [Bacteroidales bacterium]|nr:WYL domain-containing protein [Bacteroidales bacterium]